MPRAGAVFHCFAPHQLNVMIPIINDNKIVHHAPESLTVLYT